MEASREIEKEKLTEEMKICKKMFCIKEKKECEDIQNKMEQLREQYIISNFPEDIVRAAIISYLMECNPLHSLWNNSNIKTLANEFSEIFTEKDIINNVLVSLNKTFKDPSPFKIMISFNNDVPSDKKHFECFFKILLIKQNLSEIIEGLENLLSIKNENIKNQINKLKFQNPYSILLLRDLISNLITKEESISAEQILTKTKEKMKYYYVFHCPQCLIIEYVYARDKEITIVCTNKHNNTLNEITDLKNRINFQIKCEICGIIIEIYETNFKCITCKKFFCEVCAKKHNKDLIQSVLINIYEIGYICEEHLQKYTTFCGLCKQNLCHKCVNIHYHKIDKNNLYKVNTKLIKKKKNRNLNDIENPLDYIKAGLSFAYSFMKSFSYFNIFIQLSLWFIEKNDKKDNINTNDYFFDAFFDENFKKYYVDLIGSIKIGNYKNLNILKSIEEKYTKSKKPTDNSYLYFAFTYSEKENIKKKTILDFIQVYKDDLFLIDMNFDKLNLELVSLDLNSKIQQLEADNKLLKIKILSLFNTAALYESYLGKIINRYLSDFIIRILIQKFPQHFNKVKITVRNLSEIMTHYSEIFFSKEKDLFKTIKDKNINENSSIDNSEEFKSFLQKIKGDNILSFKTQISINDDQFSVDELNFVLNTLFYFKSQGNIIAHPNISKHDAIKIQNINKELLKLEISANNQNNENNITNTNDEELKNNLEDEATNKVIAIMEEIKVKILNDISEFIIEEKIDILSILNSIFGKEYNKLFTRNSAFIRNLSISFDAIIKNALTFNKSDFEKIDNVIKETDSFLKEIEYVKKDFDNLELELKDEIFNKIKYYVDDKFKIINKVNQETGLSTITNSHSTFFRIISSHIKRLAKNKSAEEIDAFILSILIPKIKDLELNNLNIYKKAIPISIKQYYILNNSNKILEKMIASIENHFKKIKEKEEINLIDSVKNYISNTLKINNPNEIDINRIFYIIKELIGEKKFEWLSLFGKDEISLESYLYYCQNK